MKILGITPFVWSKGGIPSLYEIQEEFAKLGHEVHLVAPDINPLMLSSKKSFDKKNSKIFVHRFKLPFSLCAYLERLQSTVKTGSKAYFLIGAIKVATLFFSFTLLSLAESLEIAKKVKPDVVYSHTYLSTMAAFLVSRILGVPHVMRIYGTAVLGITDSKNILRISPFRLLASPDALFLRIPADLVIITDDGTGGDKVAERVGVSPSKIRFWRNGINKHMAQIHFDNLEIRKKLHIPPDKKIILSISRLVDWKRVDRIIASLSKVVTQYPNVICLLIGEGPEREKLEKMRDELGLIDYVKFVGEVSHEKVWEYLSISDICIFLYDLSNVSNSLLEAMVCGKCVVALNTGWTGEIVKDGKNGILLDKTELPRLPDIIVGLLNNPKFITKLGRNAQTYALANLQTWRERAEMEIKEIKSLVLAKKCKKGR